MWSLIRSKTNPNLIMKSMTKGKFCTGPWHNLSWRNPVTYFADVAVAHNNGSTS